MVCQGPYWQLREHMTKTELYVLPKLPLAVIAFQAMPLPRPPATNLSRAQATQQLSF